MTTYTVKCKLVAKEVDLLEYQTLVFQLLEKNCPFGHSYCMVTVFPNWESRIPEVTEIGYLEYDEVEGGIDKYYDRVKNSMEVYNFSNLIFKRFVKEQDNSTKKEIIL